MSRTFRRAVVDTRIGFFAVFYNAKAPTTSPVNWRHVILPDDAVYFSYGSRTETLNLAPRASARFILPNVAPEDLLLIPASQADVQFPGDATVRCADVYTAPGTLYNMREEPMPALPHDEPKKPAPYIPPPPQDGCVKLDPNDLLRTKAALQAAPTCT